MLSAPDSAHTSGKQVIVLVNVPAWLSLILAAHRVQLRGARRESPSW